MELGANRRMVTFEPVDAVPAPREELPEGVTPEFAAAVEEFMEENDEVLRRLADA